MNEGNIVYLTDSCLITCVVEKGRGDGVVAAARSTGATGALIHSVRGFGVRERLGLLAVAIDAEKEVVTLIAAKDQAEMVANAVYVAVGLDRPGSGLIYITELEMVATYLPNELRNRLAERSA